MLSVSRLVALATLAAAVLHAPPQASAQSLEELLAKARRERALVQERLKSEVEALIKELEAHPDPRDLPAKLERAVQLGPEAVPLFVKYVDAGDAATDAERARAAQVALALARLPTESVLTELFAILRQGSGDGRRNALRVLQSSSDRTRVEPEVLRVFRSSEGSLKVAALRALIAMPARELPALLTEILGGSDDALIGMALDGLAEHKCAEALDAVRRVLVQSQLSARHALALLRYFQAQPALAQAADIQQFVRLAQSAALTLELRVMVVDGLFELDPSLTAEFKKQFEPIVTSADRRLREAGLVLLTKLGDKGARRDLIKEYDDLVAKNERWFDAYVRRADMYARIGDDDEAIKDYKQAASVGRDENLPTDYYERFALAYVREGKLKDAADLLNRAPISSARLRELADDPRYAALRNSKYGKDAFGLK
jgi:hypothetical protein